MNRCANCGQRALGNDRLCEVCRVAAELQDEEDFGVGFDIAMRRSSQEAPKA